MLTNPERPRRWRTHRRVAATCAMMLTATACSNSQPSTASTWDAMLNERWETVVDRSAGDARTAFDEWAATACFSPSFAEELRRKDPTLTAQITNDEYDQILAIADNDCGLLPSRPDRPILAD